MRKRLFKKWWIKWPAIIGLIGIGLCLGLYGSIYLGFWGKVPTESDLADLKQMQASVIYGKDNQLLGKYYITNRESVEFDALPQALTNALIATEDFRFYQHNGIDKRSLMRVFFKTILMGDESSGGGSTITMQLAKNLYGRNDYGFLSIVINKLRETIVARRLEEVYSKHEILTLYFNTVPFSGNTYGIESAAQKFFNTSTENLSIGQAATLVGTLKANHSFNPRLFPERSQLRRDVVLHQMVKRGYLPAEQAETIMRHKIDLDFQNYASSNSFAPYFIERVRQKTLAILAKKENRKPDGSKYDLLKDGLKIYTTLDMQLQKYAHSAMRKRMKTLQEQFENSYGNNPPWRRESSIVKRALKRLPRYTSLKKKGLSETQIIDSLSQPRKTDVFSYEKGSVVKSLSPIDSLRYFLKFLNTGLISVEPGTGAIRAYIGGIDYNYFQYDHVVQSRRQVGSTFKPFVYTAALEHGLQPCDYFPVQPVTYTDQHNWTPKNAGGLDDPDLNYSLTAALTHSINTIAVKVLRKTGIQNIIDQVHAMGIEEDIPHEPSIALGTADIRIIDMAEAYTSYLNDGRPSEPYFIRKIVDKHGNVIAEFHHNQEKTSRAFSKRTGEIMLEMLQRVVDKGTGRRLRYRYHFRNDLAGKTGTTQNNTDGWFVGLLPHLVTVVWVGNDNHSIKFASTAMGQGANTALPIFAGMLQKMNQDEQFNTITQARFPAPSRAVVAAMDCPPKKRDGFLKRLFEKDNVKKEFSKDKKDKGKKKGFFERLFGG